MLLFKRLESSIEAFRSTLRLPDYQQSQLPGGACDPAMFPIGSTATRLLSGQSFDVDDLLEVIRQEEQRRQAVGK